MKSLRIYWIILFWHSNRRSVHLSNRKLWHDILQGNKYLDWQLGKCRYCSTWDIITFKMTLMHSLYSTKKTSKAMSDVGNYFHIPIIHLVYPQMSCISFVSNFTRDLQSSQENLKTILMQKFWGKTMCIMVNVKVVNVFFFSFNNVQNCACPRMDTTNGKSPSLKLLQPFPSCGSTLHVWSSQAKCVR